MRVDKEDVRMNINQQASDKFQEGKYENLKSEEQHDFYDEVIEDDEDYVEEKDQKRIVRNIIIGFVLALIIYLFII